MSNRACRTVRKVFTSSNHSKTPILQIFQVLVNYAECETHESAVCQRAGGRVGALRSAPTPQGVKGVSGALMQLLRFFRFLRLRGVRLCRRPLPKSDPKSDQKSNQKKVQNFDPKWPPKGTLKISKISPNLQNGTLKHLSRAPLAAFVSKKDSKSSPRTSRTSKMIVLL